MSAKQILNVGAGKLLNQAFSSAWSKALEDVKEAFDTDGLTSLMENGLSAFKDTMDKAFQQSIDFQEAGKARKKRARKSTVIPQQERCQAVITKWPNATQCSKRRCKGSDFCKSHGCKVTKATPKSVCSQLEDGTFVMKMNGDSAGHLPGTHSYPIQYNWQKWGRVDQPFVLKNEEGATVYTGKHAFFFKELITEDTTTVESASSDDNSSSQLQSVTEETSTDKALETITEETEQDDANSSAEEEEEVDEASNDSGSDYEDGDENNDGDSDDDEDGFDI